MLNLQPKLYVLLKYLFSKTCEFRRIWLPVSEKSNSCKGSLKRFFSAQTSHWLNIIYFNNKMANQLEDISNLELSFEIRDKKLAPSTKARYKHLFKHFEDWIRINKADYCIGDNISQKPIFYNMPIYTMLTFFNI